MSIFTVTCPSCETEFPVDPAKVPRGGVRARCSVCGGIFPVAQPEAPAEVIASTEATAAEPLTEAPRDPVAPAEPAEPPVSTADRLGEVAFPEGGPEPDSRPEPWSGVEDDELAHETEGEGGEVYSPDPIETGEELDLGDDEAGLADATWFTEVPAPDEAPDLVDEPEPLETLEWPELAPLKTDAAEEVEEVGEEGPEEIEEVRGEVYEEVREEVREEMSAEIVDEVGDDVGTADEGTSPVSPIDEAPLPQSFQFGRRDPHDKARRLARVLVSDIITYNPERYLRALENDSLAADFEEEIQKSWAEYVDQVGSEIARETTYWTEALNDLLARGRDIF